MTDFRAIEREDLTRIKNWRNSAELSAFCREYRLLNDADQDAWFDSYQRARHDTDWGQELMMINAESVGGFVRIQWRNRRAEVSYLTNLPHRYIHPQYEHASMAVKEEIMALLWKGFYDFGFNKITWPVYAHHPFLGLFKSIMVEEAILKDEYFQNGEFLDRHYLSLTKKQFDRMQKVC